MNISWYGTASLALSDGRTKILFDPYLRPNNRLPEIRMDDFSDSDAILLTHGHIDHTVDVPRVMRTYKNLPVYCTKTPTETLKKFGVSDDRINTVTPDDIIEIGDFKIRVIASRHVVFDFGFIVRAIPRFAVMLQKAIPYFIKSCSFPEAEETVMYEVENGGKKVLISGSFGTVEGAEYTKEPDMFVFPFNGSMSVDRIGTAFMKEIQPKTVFLSHFDNSFPPFTGTMNTDKLKKLVTSEVPGVKFIIPEERIKYEI